MQFQWSARFGVYELTFTANGREYTYEIWDKLRAEYIINLASRNIGRAWAKLK